MYKVALASLLLFTLSCPAMYQHLLNVESTRRQRDFQISKIFLPIEESVGNQKTLLHHQKIHDLRPSVECRGRLTSCAKRGRSALIVSL